MKEITGNGIFAPKGENDTDLDGADQASANKTGLRMYQQAAAAIRHISFGEEETAFTKKPTALHEVAKQRELSGNLESEAEAKLKKQISDVKCKELSGHDNFYQLSVLWP